jgi:hypothetical protein
MPLLRARSSGFGRPVWCILASSGIVVLLCLQACASHGPADPVVSVNAEGTGTQIVITADAELTLAEISCPSGIGSADFEITSGPIPQRLVLRFLLTGLEHLDFSYGSTTVTVSVSSGPGREVRETVRLSTSEPEQELSADSPYWMAVSLIPAEDPPPTPLLRSGAIEVWAPADYLNSGLRSFSIDWIDYYR